MHKRTYVDKLRAYSILFLGDDRKQELNYGNKIFLPADSLKRLNTYKTPSPYLFKITNKKLGIYTYCGVIEFTAERGYCHLPKILMETLSVTDGDFIDIIYQEIYPGKFIKMQPYKTKFIELPNPKGILEDRLKNYAVLKKGETITIKYLTTEYKLLITDCKPTDAIKLLDVEHIELDFEPPKDYEEHIKKEVEPMNTAQEPTATNKKFIGSAMTIGSSATPSKMNAIIHYKKDKFNPKSKRLPHGIVMIVISICKSIHRFME